MRIENMPGWKGNISRIEAEKSLKGRGLGTYVLHRAKVWTQLKGVDTYFLITIKEAEKISEQMIVHTKKGWTVYRDEPDLNDTKYYQYFSELEVAMKTLVPQAKTPV